MMRSQISLELLIYMALAGASLAASMPWVAKELSNANQQRSAYETLQFVESINLAIMQGSAQLGVFVPEGLCSASVNGTELETRSGNFFFLEPVTATNAFCPDNTDAELAIAGQGGRVSIERIR